MPGDAERARTRAVDLYRTAWLLCGDRERAAGLVQEALADPPGRIRSRRSHPDPERRMRDRLVRAWRDQGADAEERPVEAASVGVAPPEREAAREERLATASALAELDPTDRGALVLRRVNGWPRSAVAAQLGLDEEQVDRRAGQALLRVGAALGTWPSEEAPGEESPGEESADSEDDEALIDRLRAVARELHPDADRLLAEGSAQAHRRRRRIGYAVAAAGVVVAALVVTQQSVDQPAAEESAASADPTTATPYPGQTRRGFPRTAGELASTIRSLLPAPGPSDLIAWQDRFGGVEVRGARLTWQGGRVLVTVDRPHEGRPSPAEKSGYVVHTPASQCQAAVGVGGSCERTEDGGWLMSRPTSRSGQHGLEMIRWLPDGLRVWVFASSAPAAGPTDRPTSEAKRPVLSRAQLREIVLADAWR